MRRSSIPLRLGQLYIGLVLYGVSAALQVRAGLGLDPWDVFHQGVARRLGWSLGTVVIVVGMVVLIAWVPLRERPGLGTLSNVVLVGLALDAALRVIPAPHPMVLRVGMLAAGIVCCGMATGMYIGARFGPGPRDGLMTGLARGSGVSIRLTRTALEATVLAAGWLLGGTVGVGTVAFAASIGPLSQLFLRLFGANGARVGAVDDVQLADQALGVDEQGSQQPGHVVARDAHGL